MGAWVGSSVGAAVGVAVSERNARNADGLKMSAELSELESKVETEATARANNDILLKKMKRDYAALQAQLAATKEEAKGLARAHRKAETEVENYITVLLAKQQKVDELSMQLRAATDASEQIAQIVGEVAELVAHVRFGVRPRRSRARLR